MFVATRHNLLVMLGNKLIYLNMKKLIIITLALVCLAFVFAPELSFAVTNPSAAANAAVATAGLENPLGTDDIRVLIGMIIKAILGLSGALALLMFIWGGLMWMMSRGDKKKIEDGQKTLEWAVIGLAVLFVAYAAVNWVINALQQSAG
jgi:hypothetical protein